MTNDLLRIANIHTAASLSLSHQFTEQLGWVLVHSLWQFAAIALVGFLLDRLLRRSSSAIRYVMRLCGLVLMVAAPVVTWAMIPDPADANLSADLLSVNGERSTKTDPRLSSQAADGQQSLSERPAATGNRGAVPTSASVEVAMVTSVVAMNANGRRIDAAAAGKSRTPTHTFHHKQFDILLTDIDHFEYRLRPYRHWVTFENVSLQAGQKTDVKVAINSIPIPEEDARAFGPESHGLQFRLVALSPDVDDHAPDLTSVSNDWIRSADMTYGVELKNVTNAPLTLAGVRYGNSFAKEVRGTLRTEMIAPHWFEFEFTDQDGQPISRTHREYYRQWGVVDSASTHALESGQSLTEVLRPARFDAPMSFDLPPGRYRVRVRYRGPDEELRENVRQHWPDKAIVNAWSHDVVSNSVEFEVKEASRRVKPEDLVWGKPVEGLQAALEYRVADDVIGNPRVAPGVPVGTSIGIRFHVRNVSDKPMTFVSETSRQSDFVHVVDERGNKIEVRDPWQSGHAIFVAWKLEPGEMAQLQLLTPGLRSLYKSGKYAVRYTVRFNNRQHTDDEGKVIFGHPGDYDKELDTGDTPLFLYRDEPGKAATPDHSASKDKEGKIAQEAAKESSDPTEVNKEPVGEESRTALLQQLTEKPSVDALQLLLEKSDSEQPKIIKLLLDSRRGPGAGDGGSVKVVPTSEGVIYVVLADVVPIVTPNQSGIREEDSHAEAAFVFDAKGTLLSRIGGEFHRFENRFDADDVDVVSLGPNEDWFVRVMNFQYQAEPFSYRSTYYRLANPVIQSVRFLHYPNTMSWSNGPEVVNRWGELSFEVPGSRSKQSWKLTGKDEQGIELQAKLIWDGDRNHFLGAARLDAANTALYQVDPDWSKEFESLKLRDDQVVINGGARSYEHWHMWQFVVPSGQELKVGLRFTDADGAEKHAVKILMAGYHMVQLQVAPAPDSGETKLQLRIDEDVEDHSMPALASPLSYSPSVIILSSGEQVSALQSGSDPGKPQLSFTFQLVHAGAVE